MCVVENDVGFVEKQQADNCFSRERYKRERALLNYKYCHNSVNIGDISAYLSTTDITVYQGIYGI